MNEKNIVLNNCSIWFIYSTGPGFLGIEKKKLPCSRQQKIELQQQHQQQRAGWKTASQHLNIDRRCRKRKIFSKYSKAIHLNIVFAFNF